MKRIDNNSVVDKVVKQITDSIVQGELKPGDKIPTEIELIETLQVGRNSIREAIKMLLALGLLEIRRGDGTYITKNIQPSVLDPLIYSVIIEQSSRTEIFELRETLEVDILELAIDKANEEDINKLKKLLIEADKAFNNKDFNKLTELDLQFHFTLIEIAGNKLLGRIAKGIMQLFFSSIQKTLENHKAIDEDYNRNHKSILALIINKDKQNIKNVIKKSLEDWILFVK